MEGKRFIGRQETFVCERCGADVAPLEGGTYRDHCPECLAGQHVDLLPGDRAAGCGGRLEPIGLVGNGTAQQIAYRCRDCGHRVRNRTAPDDDVERLVELASRPAPCR